MTEKTKTLIAGAMMLFSQAVIAWAVWLSSWCMACNWTEGGQADRDLPGPTVIALQHGQTIPLVAAILTALVVAVVLRRNSAAAHWLLGVAVLELLALSVFAVAIAMPALTTTYRIGP